MAPAPQRKRPSSTIPIKIAPAVESVIKIEEQQIDSDHEQVEQATPTELKTAPKVAVNLRMDPSLKDQARTAVLMTSGQIGGYASFSALVEAAVRRELVILSDRFNDGDAFPETGRDLRALKAQITPR